ncbi:MAG: hypothetical protein EA384_01260 [Spirochaetaceae bacterium]|nr:MAG: hypothetical protein EA384_01260 [Spirochaetaceae bacterium]
MKKRTTTLLLVLVGLSLAAADARADTIDVSIRYFNQSVYFPHSDIDVKVTITNNSPQTFRFRLADNRVFNLGFDVRTLTNSALEAAEQVTTQRLSIQPVYFRQVTLEPGEELSFVENLQHYVQIPRPGMYVVTAHFYPELIQRAGVQRVPDRLESNRLSLSVRPSPRTLEESIQARLDHETGEILRRTALSPDQVVTYTVEALMRSQWDRFFLYLNLEEILRASPARERRFLQLSQEDQHREIEHFRRQLMQGAADEDITAIPERFDILRTTYERHTGRVVADLRFRADGFTEIRRYTYHLQKRDDIWEIVRYDVNIAGVE